MRIIRRHQIKHIAIETLEENLRQAMLSSDVLALDELIADDLAFTTPDGLVANKQMDPRSASL